MKGLKLKKIDDLRKLDQKSLKDEITLNSKKLYELRMKKSLGELKQTHLLRYLRRYIALMKTVAVENNYNIG